MLCYAPCCGAAGGELYISHDIIKKYALLNIPYKDYIFSYESLSDQFYLTKKVSD
jgi:hypothetical protein